MLDGKIAFAVGGLLLWCGSVFHFFGRTQEPQAAAALQLLPIPPWDAQHKQPFQSHIPEQCDVIDAWSKDKSTEFKMCVRTADYLSNIVRKQHRWPQCDILASLWAQPNRAHTSGVYVPPAFSSAAEKELLDARVKRADPSSSSSSSSSSWDELFVDIGANIGSCSLLMAAMGANVVSFEPLPANLFVFTKAVLANNPSMADRMRVFPAAVGSEYAVHTIYTEDKNAGNSVLDAAIDANPKNAVNVTVVRLDDVLWPDRTKPAPRIRLIKLDAQGYEEHVLDGAHSLLMAKAVGIIKTEIAPKWLRGQGSSPAKLCAKLRSYGFELKLENGKIVTDDIIGTWERSKKSLVVDILAVLPDQVAAA
jgi:FkbM family methyltransferase